MGNAVQSQAKESCGRRSPTKMKPAFWLLALLLASSGPRCVESYCRYSDPTCNLFAFVALYAQRQARYVYAVTPGPGPGSENLLGYRIDYETGALVELGAVATVAGGSFSGMAVHPSGEFIVLAGDTGTLTTFRIDRSTGSLAAVDSDTASATVRDIVFDPGGQRLFALSTGSFEIASYTFFAAAGSLAPNPPAFAPGFDARRLAIDSTGALLVTADHGSNELPSISIDPITGRATNWVTLDFIYGVRNAFEFHPNDPVLYFADAAGFYNATVNIAAQTMGSVNTISSGSQPSDLVVAATGSHAWMSDSIDGSIYRYRLDPSSGDAALVGQTSAGTGAAGAGPFGLAVDERARFVYVANSTDGVIYGYRFDSETAGMEAIGAYPANAGVGRVAIVHF